MTTSSTKVRGGNCDTCDAQDCVCPPGPQGSRGAAGATGATGATGTPGINGPGVRVTRDAPFEVPLPNVDTAVVFQASRFNDLPPLWTVGAPDRFVVGAGQAGKYQISGSVIWAADTGVFYSTSIFVNGVPVVTSTDVTTTPDVLGQEVSTLWDLFPGDFVQLVVRHDSPQAQTILKSSNASPELSMIRVST